ncbi:MAG: HAMP domain-containing protein [Ottowia sp.]|nr:HAMP domain-containing protein [Ottowia sp.]
MRLFNPIARKLYLRIWLAVAGSVAVLNLVVGWAWHQADEQRDRERQSAPPREVLVRNAAGELIGTAEAQSHHNPGPPPEPGPPGEPRGLEFVVTLQDGQVLNLQMPPRNRAASGGRRAGDPVLAWLRPPYGFLWVMGLAGLMVMIGVFPIARRLTQRLEALQRGVQGWGEGNLSARVPSGGQDEVGDLSRHFNDAAERVQALMDSQAALLRSQKSLLANASHELRSPLARIRMALELSGSAPTPAVRKEIGRNITELDQLIDEILLASRLDAKELDLGTLEEVDLVGLVAEEAARVNAALELAPGLTSVVVPCVSRLLRRAVRNLLENARRYGGQDVSAELSTEEGDAVLVVNDRGPGVPEDQRERIFEPFYRMPGASESNGGVGLGLALVRSIAQRHGGQVRCSPRTGGGARFTLRFPLFERDK